MAGRPKGYADWNPKYESMLLVQQIQSVLREYKDFLPMTARQIFYRMVGAYDYAKTEKDYKRLCEILVRARRAQMISFDSIRDDGTDHYQSIDYTSVDNWWDAADEMAEKYRRDRAEGQDVRMELWCEAAGMAPQLARVAFRYSVPVFSTGGFSSVTVTKEVSERVLERDVPTYFLHVGDFDPSGESIFQSMSQDIGAFVVGAHGGKWNSKTGETHELADGSQCLFKPRRVALTEDQVAEYDLPSAPPKASDSRSARWVGDTTQAEAMAPDDLAMVVRDAIEEHYDMEVWNRVFEEEKAERLALVGEITEYVANR